MISVIHIVPGYVSISLTLRLSVKLWVWNSKCCWQNKSANVALSSKMYFHQCVWKTTHVVFSKCWVLNTFLSVPLWTECTISGKQHPLSNVKENHFSCWTLTKRKEQRRCKRFNPLEHGSLHLIYHWVSITETWLTAAKEELELLTSW